MQRKKIELYRTRSFSEKLSATFDYLSENGRLLFKFLLYLILPVSIVQALGMNTFMEYSLKGAINEDVYSQTGELFSLIAGYSVFMLMACIGSLVCSSLVYGLMRLYNERAERLEGLTLGSFRPYLLRGMKRSFILGLVVTVLISVFVLVLVLLSVAAGSDSGIAAVLVLCFIALIVCLIPLSLSLPAYIVEDITVMQAMSKAFRLGFKTWGGIFAVILVMYIVVSVISGASAMPWYIMMIARSVFLVSDTADSAGFAASPVYTIIMYLLAVVQAFDMYVGYVFMYTGIGIQYGHAADKIDGMSVERDVDNFERLSDNNIDDSELFKY